MMVQLVQPHISDSLAGRTRFLHLKLVEGMLFFDSGRAVRFLSACAHTMIVDGEELGNVGISGTVADWGCVAW